MSSISYGFARIGKYLGLVALGRWASIRFSPESVLLLTTTGRRTGKPHRVALGYVIREGVIYVISGGGRRADWFRNILQDNRVEVTIRRKRFSGLAEIVTDETLRKDLLKMFSEKLHYGRSWGDKPLVRVNVEANA